METNNREVSATAILAIATLLGVSDNQAEKLAEMSLEISEGLDNV